MDDAAPLNEKLLSLNEALLLGSVRQHELTAAAEKLNEQLRLEIAERERIEAQMNEALAVAEKANLAKSEFLSSMSHELRTPLHAILGFAQLIVGGSPPPTSSQKGSIDQILKAGWYLLDMINEILDLTLIEAGPLALPLELVSLAEVLSECQAMMEPKAQERAISVSLAGFESGCLVQADRIRVKQVLINLLSNAIKYNRPSGTVDVRCNAIGAQRVRVSVEDSGQGMTAEQLAQLFQPFNRLGKEGGAAEGTGIGLVVSKRLVELMGGSIGAQSTFGVGSVFWFELASAAAPAPALGAAQPAAPAQASEPAVAAARSLLYVEDNASNLLLVEQLIARRPELRLLSARDGIAGVEKARACRPDVILMDINLPGMNGIAALEVLADDPLTAHIPVIAITANAMPHDIEKGLAAGFFRYLTKPIKVNEFMATLDEALHFAAATPAGAN